MRFTVHKTLFKFGGIRFGIGYGSKKNPLIWFLLIFSPVIIALKYTLIGCIWGCYWALILTYYLMKYVCIGLYLFYKWCVAKPIIWIIQKIKIIIKRLRKNPEDVVKED